MNKTLTFILPVNCVDFLKACIKQCTALYCGNKRVSKWICFQSSCSSPKQTTKTGCDDQTCVCSRCCQWLVSVFTLLTAAFSSMPHDLPNLHLSLLIFGSPWFILSGPPWNASFLRLYSIRRPNLKFSKDSLIFILLHAFLTFSPSCL